MRKGLGFHNRRSPGNYFTPAALFPSGTAGAWYDPSDSTTLFSDTAGTTPSPTPGAGALSVVGKMLDKSGNGNHAISYNTTTARPELSARVNLLTFSEQFDNAAWSRDGVTISANTLATTDPLGGNTADKIEEQITSAAHVVYTSGISASAIQYNISVYVKAAERTFARLDCVTTGYTAGTTVILNLNTLATTITNYGATSGTTAQVVTVGNGWYRLVVTFTATAASYFAQIGPAIASTPSTYAGTAGSGIYAWGADLRPANIGTSVPAYQRIADQYTYDSSGFPRYLVFNGTASGMYTPANLNLSGTDKVTVFAGVRKISGTTGVISELSADTQTNAGSFVLGSAFVSATSYDVQVRGSARNARYYETYTAPISNVLSSQMTTAAADSATAAQTRVNGTVTSGLSFLSAASTGNFGTYALNIGVRSATATPSLFLNGWIYSLIVVGAASTAAQITSTESWINVKEGGVY